MILGDDVAHILRVLRMEAGDCLTLCDGAGADYEAVITAFDKTRIETRILSSAPSLAEPKTRAVLFQCLPKQGKMESIIQKATELGVLRVVPVYSRRCVAKPSGKTARWQKVAAEAAKQCGRGRVPEVSEAVSFPEALSALGALEKRFMLYEEERNGSLKEQLAGGSFSQVGFLVGPEGGFDPEEARAAEEAGIPRVGLGRRILRCETAGPAVLAVIMYSQNDI